MTTEALQILQGLTGIVVSGLTLAGTWMMLRKMGEKGWKALVPFYCDYLLFKHVWSKNMYWLTLALGLVAGLGVAVAMFASYGMVSEVAGGMGLLLLYATVLVRLVIGLVYCNRLSHSFGHGLGYTVGLVLAPEIFVPILGFGKSEFACEQ